MRMRPNNSRGQGPPIALLAVMGALINPAVVIAQGAENAPPAADHTIENHATALVEPKHVFPTPLGDGKTFHFSEHGTISNHRGTGDEAPGNDPFSFFMVDGTKGAVDNSFGEAWTVLGQKTEKFKRQKRAWDAVRRQESGQVPDDTFEPLQETHRVTCAAGMSAEECKEIFLTGAENTIIKLPPGIGMGPYARVVSFKEIKDAKLDKADMEMIEKRTAQLKKRQTVIDAKPVVYELVTDFDFKALQQTDKKNAEIQFRCDFSNLLKYWDQTVAAPASDNNESNDIPLIPRNDLEKRWWGAFKHWLEKVTTMSKSDEGNLEAKFEKHMKLFHFDKTCKSKDGKSELKTTVDLDAEMKMGMAAHYSYLLRGHILPVPSVEDAFGYFSIQPFANMLLTLKGSGTLTTTTGDVDIFKMGFPGLSIKGIIRLGPELEITGRLDASLELSGEVRAGFEVKFPKAAVAFPHDSPHAKAIETTGGKAEVGSPKVEPILEAEISAQGRVSLTATPKLNFGISVLGGTLMEGDVFLGVDNTVDLGISAKASAGLNTEASAEFCIWADYIYRVFIGAKAEFFKNTYSWGGDYDLFSPADPIALLDRKCLSYGAAAGASSKRDTVTNGLPASDNNESNDIPMIPKRAEIGGRSTEMKERKRRAEMSAKRQAEKPIFGGLFSCPADNSVHEDPCSPLGDIQKRDLDPASIFRRQDFPVCTPLPTMFYNCKHFDSFEYRTRGPKSGRYDSIGICENVKNGILKLKGMGRKGFSGKSAVLTYKSGGNANKGENRKYACGPESKNVATTDSCAAGNRAKWQDPKAKKYNEDNDEALWLSCDEFPFNASEEGGKDAVTACVSQVQQLFQANINKLIPLMRYERDAGKPVYYKEWARQGQKPKYKLVLHESGDKGFGELEPPPVAGHVQLIDRIIGAVNLWDHKSLSFGSDGNGNNGICFHENPTDVILTNKNVPYKSFGSCKIKFKPPPAAGTSTATGIVPRGVNGTETGAEFDYNNPATWGIEEIVMDPNSKIDLDDENLEEAMQRLMF